MHYCEIIEIRHFASCIKQEYAQSQVKKYEPTGSFFGGGGDAETVHHCEQIKIRPFASCKERGLALSLVRSYLLTKFKIGGGLKKLNSSKMLNLNC